MTDDLHRSFPHSVRGSRELASFHHAWPKLNRESDLWRKKYGADSKKIASEKNLAVSFEKGDVEIVKLTD